MDDLGSADRGQVAVTLVGEDELVGLRSSDSGRYGRRTAVGRLDEVDVEVVVGEDAAADRGDTDRALGQVHLVEQLADQAVDDAVPATRAIVGRLLAQRLGALVDDPALGRRDRGGHS